METIKKFQDLLKKLFQFETSDLDFGIYRILNYKRDQIKKFIQEDLVNKVESAFTKHKDERLTNINQRFEEAKAKIIHSFGNDAITPSGELKEHFKNTPLGRDFLAIKAQKEEAKTIDEIKLQVFNDLYSFFARFYEEGDFVPQYRYSIKGHKYAIPYNGEEVKLYWANNEQYYTKTGLLFRDYTFKINDYKVIFRIASAREELGSKKATKERFFILDDEMPIENVIASEGEAISKNNDLIIRFQYRELTDKEVKHYEVEGGSNTSKQEKINQKTYDEVLKKVKDIELRASLGKEYKPVLRKSEGTEKPILLYQISRFTAKNTKDYFIHKNLKKFLSEQLDYFIKAEVLSIETLEKESFLDKHITRAKVVREIGEDIIDFLSQIEDFQKRLWEKKKFVLKTEYVITTDRIFSLCHSDPEPFTSVIPSDSKESKSIVQSKLRKGEESLEYFYDEIWNNKDQKKEWKDMGFDVPKNKEELKKKKLPIDTRYFGQEFKERLLETLTSSPVIARDKVPKQSHDIALDDLLDGLLIKSENWQALNLLFGKHKEKVQTIYIDPPYNTGSDEFLYRDRYQHSSWLSMMAERLVLARELMSKEGVIFINIDENEQFRLRSLMDDIFGSTNYLAPLIWLGRAGKGGTATKIHIAHEHVESSAKERESVALEPIEKGISGGPYQDDKGYYRRELLRQWGQQAVRREDRPSMYFPIPTPFGVDALPELEDGSAGRWRFGKGKVLKMLQGGDLDFVKNESSGKITVYRKVREGQKTISAPSNLLDDVGTSADGTKEILSLFGAKVYSTSKPTKMIERLIKFSSWRGERKDYILDFFAGSGTTAHAVMELNKEDGGKRKYILVEMANYIDTVMIPRIKKVCYSLNWKDGKPQDEDGISQFFKYQILEQYEDTLDNIELTPNKTAQTLFKDDYLLKYYLDYETRGNPSLLNIEMLKNPFAYKLRVNLEEAGEPQEMVVDIPETFNYLLGLKIKRIKARTLKCHPELVSGSKGMLKQVQHDKHYIRKYLFILGEKEGKDIAIVWRDYEPPNGDERWSDDDFKTDKEFITKELAAWTPHIVYVNGQSVLTPKLGDHIVEIRYIEPEFKRLMEG